MLSNDRAQLWLVVEEALNVDDEIKPHDQLSRALAGGKRVDQKRAAELGDWVARMLEDEIFEDRNRLIVRTKVPIGVRPLKLRYGVARVSGAANSAK